jgi:hypothetical protein
MNLQIYSFSDGTYYVNIVDGTNPTASSIYANRASNSTTAVANKLTALGESALTLIEPTDCQDVDSAEAGEAKAETTKTIIRMFGSDKLLNTSDPF